MKWIVRILFLSVLLFASQAMAAMTCTYDGQITVLRNQNHTVQIVTCEFDTTPGTAVDSLDGTEFRDFNKAIDGKYIYIDIVPGATGPTDNSDLQIVDSRSLKIIDPTTSGLNVIDNTTSTFGVMPTNNNGSSMYIRGHEPYYWTVTVTNNGVNNSSFTMYIEAVN